MSFVPSSHAATAISDTNAFEYITIKKSEIQSRSSIIGTTYDVGYNFYRSVSSVYNNLGGGNIYFTSNPQWKNDNDYNANSLEITLYRKGEWWFSRDQYEWVRTLRKNGGKQTVKWSAPCSGEYKIVLKMAKQSKKWTYDGSATLYNCQ